MGRYFTEIRPEGYVILDSDINLNVVKLYPREVLSAIEIVNECRIMNLEEDDYDRYTNTVIEYATDSPAHARSMWNIVMFGHN